MLWQVEKIIDVAIDLKNTGSTAASTGERIAAAFALNRMDFLPDTYDDVIEAWERLDEDWQGYVKLVKEHHMHLINT